MRSWIVAIVFLLLLGGMVLWEEHKQVERFEKVRKAEVAGCERVNLVRRETNSRATILRNFLNDAALTREQTAQMQRGREAYLNRRAAHRWRQWAHQVHEVPIPDCERAFPEPKLFASLKR